MRKHALAIALSLSVAACTGSQKPPCTSESVTALRTLYTHAARDVIESGACDKYTRVEQCPGYLVIEKHFELAAKAMCAS